MENQDTPQREIEVYEYRVIATPEYCAYIDENWEIHKVFHTYLDNGHHSFALVFRRRMKRKELETPHA